MRYEEREFITMYQIDYTNVGKRMKTLRKQAGYTQEQIADALDVTVAFISNILEKFSTDDKEKFVKVLRILCK